MKAEELISMAAARGIDLIAAAQQSTDVRRRPDVETRTRCGVRITKLVENTTQRAYGRATASIDEPEWSSADAGLALAGLPRAQTLAALYAWAGHEANYWPLVTELRRIGIGMQRRYHWQQAVYRQDGTAFDYVERLAEMVLFDDRYPGVLDVTPEQRPGQDDQTGILRAVFCEVGLMTWRRHLADHYRDLRGVWIGWLDEAAQTAQARLREEGE